MVDIFSNKLKSFMTKLKNYIYLVYGLVHGYIAQFTTLLAFIEMRFHTKKYYIFQYKPSARI